jgi:hypothetical protein
MTDHFPGPRVWISSEHAASVAAQNFRIVHAPSDYFYLVCIPSCSSATNIRLPKALYRIVVRESG